MAEFYSTGELAGRWKVDPQRVSRMAARGEVPAVRVGRQWRFFKRAVHLWEAEHQQPAGA